jgi:hypothetical protein
MSYHNQLTDKQVRLIESSRLFFVASTDPTFEKGPDDIGPLNLSPKGGLKLHILDRNRVAYLDFGGSGDETARHAAMGGPITIMVCSFEESEAAIVRLYGTASIGPAKDSALSETLMVEIGSAPLMRPRQVIEIDIFRTQTSCGYGVPVMEYVRDRQKEDRGRSYWDNKNE